MILAYYFRTCNYSVQYTKLRSLKWYHELSSTQTNEKKYFEVENEGTVHLNRGVFLIFLVS